MLTWVWCGKVSLFTKWGKFACFHWLKLQSETTFCAVISKHWAVAISYHLGLVPGVAALTSSPGSDPTLSLVLVSLDSLGFGISRGLIITSLHNRWSQLLGGTWEGKKLNVFSRCLIFIDQQSHFFSELGRSQVWAKFERSERLLASPLQPKQMFRPSSPFLASRDPAADGLPPSAIYVPCSLMSLSLSCGRTLVGYALGCFEVGCLAVWWWEYASQLVWLSWKAF